MEMTRPGSRRGWLFVFTGLVGGVAGWVASHSMPEQSRQTIPTAPFRRIVTGHDSAGRSIVTHDGHVPQRAQTCCSAEQIAGAPYLKGISANEIWLYDSVPADLANSQDPLDGEMPGGNRARKGGITARLVRYEPGVRYPMHTTTTLDLGIVISGLLELELDAGKTVVGPGEVVVQRGTHHGWRVVGDQSVLVMFVLVDAINGPAARPAA